MKHIDLAFKMKLNIIISIFLLLSPTLAQSLSTIPACAVSPIRSPSTPLLAYANLAGSKRALLMPSEGQGAPQLTLGVFAQLIALSLPLLPVYQLLAMQVIRQVRGA